MCSFWSQTSCLVIKTQNNQRVDGWSWRCCHFTKLSPRRTLSRFTSKINWKRVFMQIYYTYIYIDKCTPPCCCVCVCVCCCMQIWLLNAVVAIIYIYIPVYTCYGYFTTMTRILLVLNERLSRPLVPKIEIYHNRRRQKKWHQRPYLTEWPYFFSSSSSLSVAVACAWRDGWRT